MSRGLILLLGALAPGLQDDPGGAPPRVFLADRTEVSGEILGYEPTGHLRFREKAGARERRVALEVISRIQYASEDKVQAEVSGERVRLIHGGLLSGRLRALTEKTATLETSWGTLELRRADIRSINSGSLAAPMPELRDGRHDVLIRELLKVDPATKAAVREAVVDYGRLKSLGGRVQFHSLPAPKEGEAAPSGPGKDEEFDRAELRQAILFREDAPVELPPGWYARLLFANGDKVVGVLQGISTGRLRIFSHLFGAAEVETKRLHSLTFVSTGRMAVGNLLLCDSSGVRELTRQGKEVWSYAQDSGQAWSARKLDNGNVLIANTNQNQVIEVKPLGRSGGKEVWRLDNASYPYDAVKLENGNILVAEYYGNRVVEYDPTTRASVWTCARPYPMSVQRLPSGHTLICSQQEVVEVNREGQEKWRARVQGLRPFRASRLENGNTLVVDQQRGLVVELDSESRCVWEKKGLQRPYQAIRLEDGNTLILEHGADRIIEIDAANPARIMPEIKPLNMAQAMSLY